MAIWSSEIKELEKLYESFNGQLAELEKELGQLIKSDDPNVIMLYSRRCLEVIITDLCECELKRPRKTEPLKGIIDKLQKEEKVPSHIISSMHGLNELSTYGAHPKDFDPEQVKPVLVNLDIIIKWYLKYKEAGTGIKTKPTGEIRQEIKSTGNIKRDITISRKRLAGIIGGSIAIIVSVFAILYFSHIIGNGKQTKELEKSIAVLPFEVWNSKDEFKYLGDAIASEINTKLSLIKKFHVISYTSSSRFRGSDKPSIPIIGKKLGANFIIEGSVERQAEDVSIQVQVINAIEDDHILAREFPGKWDDIFTIRANIAKKVAEELSTVLSSDEIEQIEKKPTHNIEAYNLYLKGTYFWQMFTSEGYKKASEYFEQALKIDPDYALAYVGLADVKMMTTTFGNVPPNEAYPKAIEYLSKALKIDSMLAEAYNALGNINVFYYWKMEEAEKNFKHALLINPNSSLIHIDYSYLLAVTGRLKEAFFEAKQAEKLDPLSVYIKTKTADILAYSGQIDQAIEEYQMCLTINPNYYLTHFALGFCYLVKGMTKEAFTEYKKAFDLSDGNTTVLAGLICQYYRMGETDQANKLFENLQKRSETEYVPATDFYRIYVVRGEEDLAFRWFKKAIRDHDTHLINHRVHPFLIPDYSRYMSLLKEAGMDY